MKNCWIICGPESSGSTLLAKTISFVTGHCDYFGQYSGYGYNNVSFCENLVLHRSLPYSRPKKFQDALLEEINTFSSRYDKVHYILTTRDKNVSIHSKMRRFGGTRKAAEEDYDKALPFFANLVQQESCYIWNYESMVLLGKSYFLHMYRFFGIESDFVPNIYDGNARYFTSRPVDRIKQFIRAIQHHLNAGNK